MKPNEEQISHWIAAEEHLGRRCGAAAQGKFYHAACEEIKDGSGKTTESRKSAEKCDESHATTS